MVSCWSNSPGNLAAMAAYVKEAPLVVPAVALPAAPAGPRQKTREALEAAAMQPMYVKDLGEDGSIN